VAARLRAQDPGIHHELVLRHGVKLRRFLMRMTANREVAEDLAQETWLRVITRGSQFKGDSGFATWLFAIARNLAADRVRRTGKTSSLEELSEQGEAWEMDLTGNAEDAYENFAAGERARLLKKALTALRPQQRKILELRFFQEMTFLDLARELNAPLPAVKGRLYRSLALLRRQLEARYPNETAGWRKAC
jgi:RNA polymerase sigma-70 factor, ECF subfamily